MFCDHCSEMFVNRQSLEKHMFVHVEEVFQCHNCKKKFLTQRELEAHNNKTQKCKPKVNETGRLLMSEYILNVPSYLVKIEEISLLPLWMWRQFCQRPTLETQEEVQKCPGI